MYVEVKYTGSFVNVATHALGAVGTDGGKCFAASFQIGFNLSRKRDDIYFPCVGVGVCTCGK
jgi:hypothetical protein